MTMIWAVVGTLLLYFSKIVVCSTSGNETSPFASLLGESLFRWSVEDEGIVEEYTDDLLKGKKVVGVYFSASWCGPCRFVQKLSQRQSSFFKHFQTIYSRIG